MTDLDTLRRALRAEQPSAWSAGQCLDVDQIMTQGRRLRWRRRLAVGGAVVVCVTAAVSGVLAGTGHAGRAAPVPAQRPASPTHVVRQMPTSLPSRQAPTPTLTPSPASSLAPDPSASPSRFASPSSATLGDPLPTPSR